MELNHFGTPPSGDPAPDSEKSESTGEKEEPQLSKREKRMKKLIEQRNDARAELNQKDEIISDLQKRLEALEAGGKDEETGKVDLNAYTQHLKENPDDLAFVMQDIASKAVKQAEDKIRGEQRDAERFQSEQAMQYREALNDYPELGLQGEFRQIAEQFYLVNNLAGNPRGYHIAAQFAESYLGSQAEGEGDAEQEASSGKATTVRGRSLEAGGRATGRANVSVKPKGPHIPEKIDAGNAEQAMKAYMEDLVKSNPAAWGVKNG